MTIALELPAGPNGKIRRTPSSLGEQLIRQLSYIDNSARLFDEGDHHEANRLATTIRVLLHEGNGHSLLRQLGIKDQLRFIDTGIYRDRLTQVENALLQKRDPDLVTQIDAADVGLVELRQLNDGTGGVGWFAPLREPRFPHGFPRAEACLPPQPFAEWWETELVESTNAGKFSRWDLIRIMANQDGGAHVDPKLDADYIGLCEDSLGIKMKFFDADEAPEFPAGYPDWTDWGLPDAQHNVAAASVRQIAFELALTLHRYIDELPAAEKAALPARKKMYMPILNRNSGVMFGSRLAVKLAKPETPHALPSAAAKPANSSDPYAHARKQLRALDAKEKKR